MSEIKRLFEQFELTTDNLIASFDDLDVPMEDETTIQQVIDEFNKVVDGVADVKRVLVKMRDAGYNNLGEVRIALAE